METFSTLLALCAGNSPVTGLSHHKGQWRGYVMFLWSAPWINGWVNNRSLWSHCNAFCRSGVTNLIIPSLGDSHFVAHMVISACENPLFPYYELLFILHMIGTLKWWWKFKFLKPEVNDLLCSVILWYWPTTRNYSSREFECSVKKARYLLVHRTS